VFEIVGVSFRPFTFIVIVYSFVELSSPSFTLNPNVAYGDPFSFSLGTNTRVEISSIF